MRPSSWSVALGLSLLGLAACSTARAATYVDGNGDDPKSLSRERSVQFLRDSVFHSYLDSLDLRIESLNRAARTVDSVARELRTMPKLKVHVAGHCFGPLHIPSTEVGSDSVTVRIPEVNVPEIEIPDLDINVPYVGGDGTLLYPNPETPNSVGILSNGDSYTSEIAPNGSLFITGSTTSSTYYYSQGNSRYYIRNAKPGVKAKRATNSSSVWLLDSK